MLDLADGHAKALEYLVSNSNKSNQTCNLGSGSGASVFEIIRASEQITGKVLNKVVVIAYTWVEST